MKFPNSEKIKLVVDVCSRGCSRTRCWILLMIMRYRWWKAKWVVDDAIRDLHLNKRRLQVGLPSNRTLGIVLFGGNHGKNLFNVQLFVKWLLVGTKLFMKSIASFWTSAIFSKFTLINLITIRGLLCNDPWKSPVWVKTALFRFFYSNS